MENEEISQITVETFHELKNLEITEENNVRILACLKNMKKELVKNVQLRIVLKELLKKFTLEIQRRKKSMEEVEMNLIKFERVEGDINYVCIAVGKEYGDSREKLLTVLYYFLEKKLIQLPSLNHALGALDNVDYEKHFGEPLRVEHSKCIKEMLLCPGMEEIVEFIQDIGIRASVRK
jgi:hypothetical protein